MITIVTTGKLINDSKDAVYGYSLCNGKNKHIEVGMVKDCNSPAYAEILSIYNALININENRYIHICSSNSYITNTLTVWLEQRRKNDWKDNKGNEYSHAELWRMIDNLLVNKIDNFSVSKADDKEVNDIKKEIRNKFKSSVQKERATTISYSDEPINDDAIIVYCDGGCRGNGTSEQNVGGWGVVLKHGEYVKELCGYANNTTNNIMELTAIIQALSAIKKPSMQVVIYTDSKYVCQGVNTWMEGWKARGWERKNGELLNKELWQQLDSLLGRFRNYQVNWVKGHASNPGNNRADQLANIAMDDLERKMKEHSI